MTEKKTYTMYYPGKTDDGRGTYLERELGDMAVDRESAKIQAMALVRVLDIKDMHIVENPGELVFHTFPMGKPNG